MGQFRTELTQELAREFRNAFLKQLQSHIQFTILDDVKITIESASEVSVMISVHQKDSKLVEE